MLHCHLFDLQLLKKLAYKKMQQLKTTRDNSVYGMCGWQQCDVLCSSTDFESHIFWIPGTICEEEEFKEHPPKRLGFHPEK